MKKNMIQTETKTRGNCYWLWLWVWGSRFWWRMLWRMFFVCSVGYLSLCRFSDFGKNKQKKHTHTQKLCPKLVAREEQKLKKQKQQGLYSQFIGFVFGNLHCFLQNTMGNQWRSAALFFLCFFFPKCFALPRWKTIDTAGF